MTLEEANKFNKERARGRVVETAKLVDEIKSNPEKELKEGRLAPVFEGVKIGELEAEYEKYRVWCAANGLFPEFGKEFFQWMDEHDIQIGQNESN